MRVLAGLYELAKKFNLKHDGADHNEALEAAMRVWFVAHRERDEQAEEKRESSDRSYKASRGGQDREDWVTQTSANAKRKREEASARRAAAAGGVAPADYDGGGLKSA